MYINPFTHEARPATRDQIIGDHDAMYTIVAEVDEYVGQPITVRDDLNARYDIMITLNAGDTSRAIETLTSEDCNRAVMVFRGRIADRQDLATMTPAGYVYPGCYWLRAISNS